MKASMKIISLMSMMSVLAVLAGCTTVGKTLDLDTEFEVSFVVDENINPNDEGRASPLKLRFYELKDLTTIKNANFIDLYKDDKKILGASLLKTRILNPFTPGESRKENFIIDPTAKYIAVFAEFIEYEGAKFKLAIPAEAYRDNAQVIYLKDNQIYTRKAEDDALRDQTERLN